MRVQPLELRELADFDPLMDAVVFGTRDVRVDLPVCPEDADARKYL